MAVLQLTKHLTQRPLEECPTGIVLRHYQGVEDIEPWLALRRAAFARERLGVRDWTHADFEAEFLSRWWWCPEHMWLAATASETLTKSSTRSELSQLPALIGTVTLALRGEPQTAIPVIHWLAVHPAWRRRRVGCALLAKLESTAWDFHYRQIWLETHDAWAGAARLYERLGYRSTSGAK